MHHSPPNYQKHLQMGLFLLFFIALYLRNSNATNNMTGFSLELVDNYSIYSPYQAENLTSAEKLEEIIRSSLARINWLKMSRLSINNQSHVMALQPIVDHLENRYVAKLHIGRDRIPQNLYFDTASDLTWIQCHHCAQCYPQEKPFYWPDASKTFRPLQCNHQYCNARNCRNLGCRFSHSYFDKTSVEGNYATEHFDGIDGVIFGCARKTSRNFFGDDGKLVLIAGLLAMDASPRSFVMQLARYTQGRFSHCFVPDFARSTSYLRFGSNAVDNPNYRRTQIIRTPYNLYYVKLNDISVNGQHLNFPRGTFDLKTDGEGGCIFDSGSTVTAITPAAYKVVEDAFINYFTGYGLKPTSKGGKRSQLCYKPRGQFRSFPSMTLHFQGADLQLESFNVFYHGSDNEFCLLIMPIGDTTIIGVAMQMDLRVVYDLNNWVISFGREKCAYRS